MDKVKTFFSNPATFWGSIGLALVLTVFFVGRRLGIDEAQEKLGQKPLPDGGDSLGNWGGDESKSSKKEENSEAYAISLSEEVFKAISGVYVTPPNGIDPRIALFSNLLVLGADQLVMVYNKYNANHADKWWGFETMTEAIDSEYMLSGGTIKDKLISRLKSLKCK